MVLQFDRDDFGDKLTGWALVALLLFIAYQVIKRVL
jgi:hypothetical protein